MRLRIDNKLAIARKDGMVVAQFLGRVFRQMTKVPRGHIHQLDLVARPCLRLGGVGELAAVRRPRRISLGRLRRDGQVRHLAGLRRNQKDVPLLIAVVIGDVRDPRAVRGPDWLCLPLVAYGQLGRPAARRRHQPQVIPPADVGDEGHLLAVRRPRRAAHLARHVELLDGERLHVGHGFALELGWVGDGLRRGEQLLGECGNRHNENDCGNEKFQVSSFQFRESWDHRFLL